MKRLLIIFLIFNLFSCNQQKTDFEYLNSFTKESYSLDLSNKEIRLFFIDAQCIPCINIKNITKYVNNRNYLIITEDSEIKKLYPKLNIFVSYDRKMHQLKRNEYSNSIWDVKDNKVVYFANHIVIADAIELK